MSGKSVVVGLAERGAFSPDGRLLALTGSGPRIGVYDVGRRRHLWRRGIVSYPRALLWSNRGDALYVIGVGGRVVVLDPSSGEIARRFEHPTEDADAEWALMADGHLAHASFGRSLEILEAEHGRVVQTWVPDGRRLTRGLLALPPGQSLSVFTDAPPPDDRSPVGPTHLHVRNPQTESAPSTTVQFTSRMFMPASAVSPDGSMIALFESAWGGTPGRLTLVSARDGAILPGPNLALKPMLGGRAAWSPDGTRIAVTVDEGVAVLAADGWKITARVRAPNPQHVAWSPDGAWLFVGCSHAFLSDATGPLSEPPPSPPWREEDGLGALMALDARGAIDEDAMLSLVESALLAHLAEPTDVASLPWPARAVLLSSGWESSVTWEGVPTTALNLESYLPAIADAYRALDLEAVAAVFEKLDAALPDLLADEGREGMFPAAAPFAPFEAKMEAAGLSRAPDQRIELIRKHRAEFTRLT